MCNWQTNYILSNNELLSKVTKLDYLDMTEGFIAYHVASNFQSITQQSGKCSRTHEQLADVLNDAEVIYRHDCLELSGNSLPRMVLIVLTVIDHKRNLKGREASQSGVCRCLTASARARRN